MNGIKFKTIDEVYAKYQTNTLSKFRRKPNENGFTDELSNMECQYWINQNSIPEQISKFI